MEKTEVIHAKTIHATYCDCRYILLRQREFNGDGGVTFRHKTMRWGMTATNIDGERRTTWQVTRSHCDGTDESRVLNRQD